MLLQPEWDRSCSECRKWVHQDDDNAPADRRGLPMISHGQKVPRGSSRTPCYKCPKVPKSVRDARQSEGKPVTPADANEPEDWHREVVVLIRKFHAVGTFPDNPWVREWAFMVRPYILAHEQRATRELVSLLTLQIATGKR